jgi:hypothetical protein
VDFCRSGSPNLCSGWLDSAHLPIEAAALT